MYLYPDNSYYTGSWKAGKKHGSGTYWDTSAGCLRGEWAAGALRGQGQYDQPNYHFEGVFAKGVPAGGLLLCNGGQISAVAVFLIINCCFAVGFFFFVDLAMDGAGALRG
jgi:hypothetical protein